MALRRIVIVLAALAVGAYFMWGVRAAGHPFQWGQDLTGYYDYLGRSFAQGRLSLPVEPAPELLAQPNPYDPNSDDTYKLWDTALFHRRYYLYHGAGPAVLLFAPWRLLTGHDLPENFALVLFCFGGYLFSCGTLLRVLSLAGARAGPALLMAMLTALGICQSIPYLLNRVWVYEIAIGGGYWLFLRFSGVFPAGAQHRIGEESLLVGRFGTVFWSSRRLPPDAGPRGGDGAWSDRVQRHRDK
jgi:hypothetical protein